MIDLIYKDIIGKVNTITDCNGEYVFKFVRIFNDQIRRSKSGSGYSIVYPACLVEMKHKTGFSLGNHLTTNDIEITLHIAMWEMDNMVGGLDMNVNIFDLRDTIKRELTNFHPHNATCLMWIGDTQDYNHDGVYVHKCKFITRYIDTTSVPCETEYDGTASLALTIEYSGWTGSYPLQIEL